MKLFELKAKGTDLKLAGFSKSVDEKLQVYNEKLSILQTLLEQNSGLKRSASMSHLKQQASDSFIKTLTDRIEELEMSNYSMKIE
jgi:flagellar biosynthesis chaperone FliJ